MPKGIKPGKSDGTKGGDTKQVEPANKMYQPANKDLNAPPRPRPQPRKS